jgi:hypothetical protein
VTRRRFFLVAAEGHIHTDHFSVLAEGKLGDLQPAVDVAEGSTVEIKLGELGRYDATVGAGKLDGLDVLVADAARLVGKKATVTIGRVLDGQAFATLVSQDAGAGPITFESEAEKPTRAPARRRTAAAEEGAVEESQSDDGPTESIVETETSFDGAWDIVEPDEDDEVDKVDEVDDADDVAAGVDSDARTAEPATDGVTPAKRRTRRGSRGGRRRRKPAGAGAAAGAGMEGAAATDPASAPEDGVVAATAALDTDDDPRAPTSEPTTKSPNRRRAPRIHVPDDGIKSGASPEVIEDVVADAVAGTDTGDAATEPAADAVDGAAPPVKRKTRRGSRGGKNHRKKPVVTGEAGALEEGESNGAVALDAESSEPAAEVPAAPAATSEQGGAGYVPMSEWLDDFDRR